ncbi:hypothetical protein INR49_013595 [Caranx melampygus]|nr:hypothetical protein INR49_013595 [Caranx melampygus]
MASSCSCSMMAKVCTSVCPLGERSSDPNRVSLSSSSSEQPPSTPPSNPGPSIDPLSHSPYWTQKNDAGSEPPPWGYRSSEALPGRDLRKSVEGSELTLPALRALWCSNRDLRALRTSTSLETPAGDWACLFTTVILRLRSWRDTRHSRCSSNNYGSAGVEDEGDVEVTGGMKEQSPPPSPEAAPGKRSAL